MTPAAKGAVLDVAPQMLNTPVLSTSNVACGFVVRTPMLSPAWNNIEFPNELPLVQIGMKCGAPCPNITGVLGLEVGAVLVVFVGVWARARAPERIHRIKTADFMTSSCSKSSDSRTCCCEHAQGHSP